MKEKKRTFLWAYLIFVGVLAVLMVVCTIYVHGLLREYEAAQPVRQAEKALAQLAEEAKDAQGFWEKYDMPQVKSGKFEKDVDIQSAYLALYGAPETELAVKTGTNTEDTLCYVIKNGGLSIAEVSLKATSPLRTKLLVFSTRDWEIEKITPLLAARNYTVSVPEGFTVKAAGKSLKGVKNANGKLDFTVTGVYLQPQLTIADAKGATVPYTFKDTRVVPTLYEYTLTLPHTLSVTVNGEKDAGETLSDGRVRHVVIAVEKPEVTVSDLFGNTLKYEGDALPMTYTTVIAPAEYTVTVEKQAVPAAAVKKGVVKEYAFLESLVKDLPVRATYTIAVLKEEAAVAVTDASGKAVSLEKGVEKHDLATALKPTQTVDKAIAKKVDVLEVAKTWSMYMSNDRSFAQMQPLLHPDSYQYEVAREYATSIDRTFFSEHTLKNPAFTEEAVSNFVRISDTCFSVDVRFVKHMLLSNGNSADDAMNDRFYFVYSGDKWLLAGLKEVTDNA